MAAGASAMAIMASSPASACGAGEVCGLNLYVHDSKFYDIAGMDGVDLTGLHVKNASQINVETPKNIANTAEFSQKNTGDINANLDYYGQFIAGDFESQVAALGNNAAIEFNGGAAIEGAQLNTGSVTAKSNVTMNHLVEIASIDLNVTAVANSASFDMSGDAILDMAQSNTGDKVTARLDTLLQGQAALADADVDIAVTAVGNNLSLNHDGFIAASIAQENCADVDATAKVTINGMKDPVNVTAMGNSIQIAPVKIQ